MISIHALCEEGDNFLPTSSRIRLLFLSTPSARRATYCNRPHNGADRHFYPRPLRGGRPASWSALSWTVNFYPRPLRGGRRCKAYGQFPRSLFLSTPSARRATGKPEKQRSKEHISIHALCEEGDLRHKGGLDLIEISIHALCEEGDRRRARQCRCIYKFLSTPSARRATLRLKRK